MKRFLTGVFVGLILGGAVAAIAAGVVKQEINSIEATSHVIYGSADAGDTVVRLKTDANGVLQVKGV